MSTPALDFPARMTDMSGSFAFGGMTVDGTSYPAFTMDGKQPPGEY